VVRKRREPDRGRVKGVSLRPASFVLRTVAALLAAVVAGALAAPAAALADHPARAQQFRADSGDRCRYGFTEGILAWRAVHPPELPAVDISGMVADQPVRPQPGICPDDSRYTIAYFTAYAYDLVIVDQEARRVNNGVLDFRLTLGVENSPVQRIDRVGVQVCRVSLTGSVPTYCGRPQIYWPFPLATQG
jgi:hypothetical protein